MLQFMVLQRVRHKLTTEQQQHILKTVWRFLKELKRELPWLNNPNPLHISLSSKFSHLNKKDRYTPTFTAALFIISRTLKQPKYPSTEDWIKKIWNIYSIEYYSAIKKELDWIICRGMDGPRECHTQWSQKEKSKYRILMHIHGILKKWW